jgi:tetratricopeptide (TPR) repeat protein
MAVLNENYWQSFVGETIRGKEEWANAYHIQEFLGRGGFGGVFKAQDDTSQLVAVKLMLPADAAAREIKTALKVPPHPNLIKHIEAIDADVRGTPMYVLVMELADGGSLRDLLNERNLHGAEVKKIALDIVEGLKHLHSIDATGSEDNATGSEDKKLVHRDMKPENVLQVKGVWKIADFGSAKVLESGSMQASADLNGTPPYMPPELLQHPNTVSTKWDIWSFGVILTEMLLGHRPFDSEQGDTTAKVNEIYNKILSDNPNILDLPSDWLNIVKGCLNKKHKSRWTAEKILVELPKITSKLSSIPDIKGISDIKKDEKTPQVKNKQHKKFFDFQNNPSFLIKIALVLTVITLFAVSFYRRQDGTCFFSFNALCEIATDRQKLAENFYKKGLEKYDNKDFNGAIADYKKATEIKPDYADAYMELGNVYSDLGEIQNAVDNYTKVIEYNPNSAQAYNRRGLITLRMIKPNESTEVIKKLEESAINDYNKAISLQPDYAITYNNRGAFHRLKGNHSKAIKDFASAIKYDPQYALAYYNRALSNDALKNHKEAVSDFQESIKLAPNHQDSYYELGKKWIDLGQYDNAIKILDKLISLNSNYINAYYYRARARYKLGDKNGAILDYGKYIKAEPNDDKAYFERGVVKYDLDNKKEAITDFDKSLKIRPDYNTYYYRGNTWNYLGDKDKASDDYSKVIELKPDSADAYKKRGDIKNDKKDYSGALADWQYAIRLNPSLADAYLYYAQGLARYNLGNKKEAIPEFSEAIRLKSDFADAYYFRGNARNDIGEKDNAIADYEQAIRFKPDNAGIYYNRGLIYKEKNKTTEAKADFRKAAELYQQYGNIEWYNNSRDMIRKLGG